MSGNYDVRFEMIGDVPVIYISGDMTSDADSAVVKIFREIKAKAGVAKVIFNFSETNYINSAGLATLINVIQEMEKVEGRVVFAGLTTHFQKVMDIVGITEFVKISDTNEGAVAMLED
ncbi:MAG: STAS domain-containing protein [Spirochaetes bacterium]|nr:STAS domain-containing protein [Spirochaetota bacterium]MBN2772485.1 STAS domain-containing protein [Spirochaetota bacterium]